MNNETVYKASAFKKEFPPLTVTICRGAPGSGKSTWAREQVRLSQGKTKRINRDDIRAMVDDSVWSKQNEAHIHTIRQILVSYFLDAGCNVIIDDTNCKTQHVEALRDYIENHRVNVTVVARVFDTPLEVCLERNAKRTGVARVPENVIRKFHVELREALATESDSLTSRPAPATI